VPQRPTIWLAILALGLACGPPQSLGQRPATWPSQATPPQFSETATTFSQSGQFVVSGPRPAKTPPLSPTTAGGLLRDLTPQTLAVSCERVKSELLRALALPDTWRAGDGKVGKIFIVIDPSLRTNTPLAVAASPFESGWHFRIAFPPTLTEDRLVRTLTEALVLELSSRSGNQRLADPPLWFVEGLTQTILANSPATVALQPQSRGVTDVKLDETLTAVRRELNRRAPLGFHEMSQPDISRMSERDWASFSACAHLCVHELSRLPDGRARLVHWLGTLQKHWNWQTGFIEAFQPGFRSLLDAEKWWALTLANFTGRNPSSAWPAAFALRKLDEALQPVGVFANNGNRASRLTLDEVVRSWDFQNQVPLLRQLLRQLHAIRLTSPPEVTPIVFRYIDLLEDYLEVRGRLGSPSLPRGQLAPNPRLVVRETAGRLRELDSQRAQLAQDLAGNTPTPTPTPSPSAPPPRT
jgi:hypothetical protein